MAITQTQNSTVSDPVRAAIDALKTGVDPAQAVYGDANAVDGNPAPDSSDESSYSKGWDEEIEDGEGNGEANNAAEKDPLDAQVAEAKPEAKVGDLEDIIISDEFGRRKVKVDWSDKDKLKKYVEMAAGMRKFQSERDQLKQKVTQIEPEYNDLKKTWSAVESAYQEEGLSGLVKLVTGDAGAYDKFLQSEIARIQRRSEATPLELEAMEAREKAGRESKQTAKIQKELEELRAQISAKEEQAKLETLESQLHPAFHKYRFAGKLGDATREETVDQMVWNAAISSLDSLPDTQEVTPALVDAAFRRAASAIRGMVEVQAEKKTNKIIEQKKEAAQTKAAARATSGMRASTESEDFKNNIRSGNIVDAFKSFVSGKVKL